MPSMRRVGQALNGHDATVHDARPDREPDQTQVFEWLASGQEEEHAKSRIDADDHLQIVRLAGMPRPAGWPEHGQRIEAKQTDGSDEYQGDSEIAETLRVVHDDFSSDRMGRAACIAARPS